MVKAPLQKELRAMYPYGVEGHKKNCTCFGCGIARDEKWAKDNPSSARALTEQYIGQIETQQKRIDEARSNPIIAKANRNKALTGNSYYKIDGDSIHCADCGQRLGGLSYGCPIDSKHSGYVYGKMLNNPADERWSSPTFNKSKFLTTYSAFFGTVHEVSSAEDALRSRRSHVERPEDLV